MGEIVIDGGIKQVLWGNDRKYVSRGVKDRDSGYIQGGGVTYKIKGILERSKNKVRRSIGGPTK